MKESTKLSVKPISVNKMFQGRRFKTQEYKKWQEQIKLLLKPKKLGLPPYSLSLEIGVSKLFDIDNCLKPFIDTLQDYYGFNDRDIFDLHVHKKVVKKGEEYINFFIV